MRSTSHANRSTRPVSISESRAWGAIVAPTHRESVRVSGGIYIHIVNNTGTDACVRERKSWMVDLVSTLVSVDTSIQSTPRSHQGVTTQQPRHITCHIWVGAPSRTVGVHRFACSFVGTHRIVTVCWYIMDRCYGSRITPTRHDFVYN